MYLHPHSSTVRFLRSSPSVLKVTGLRIHFFFLLSSALPAATPVALSAALHCSVAALADKSHHVSLWWLGRCPIPAGQGGDPGAEKRGRLASPAVGGSAGEDAAPSDGGAGRLRQDHARQEGDGRTNHAGSSRHDGPRPQLLQARERGREGGGADSHAALPCHGRGSAGKDAVLLAIGAAHEGRARAGGDVGGGGRKPVVCAVMGDDVDPGAGCASCRAKAFLLRQLRADKV